MYYQSLDMTKSSDMEKLREKVNFLKQGASVGEIIEFHFTGVIISVPVL